jgi:mRNA interferase MazF
MANDRRGQVWLVDLGYAAKTRPAVIISVEPLDTERALITLVPHTTSLHGTRFEIPTKEKFLKQGAFDAQNLITISDAKLLRNLGRLSQATLDDVMIAVKQWLGITA